MSYDLIPLSAVRTTHDYLLVTWSPSGIPWRGGFARFRFAPHCRGVVVTWLPTTYYLLPTLTSPVAQLLDS